MKRYIAFLRGINISGKNKVSMAELKIGFERLGFEAVRTYLNSGNVIFSSDKNDIDGFRSQIETMVKKQFGLDIPVFVKVSLQRHNHKSQQKPSQPTLKRRFFQGKGGVFFMARFWKGVVLT